MFLLCGLAISIAVGGVALESRRQTEAIEFQLRARSHGATIERALQRNVDVLRFLADVYGESPPKDRAAFRRLARAQIQRFPSVAALSWNRRIPAALRSRLESERRDGRAFQIRERAPDGTLVPAGPRPDYVTVWCIEPLEPNRSAVGFDIASDPSRRDAIERAFRTGRPSVTAGLRLVQDDRSESGVLLMAPLYPRRAVDGDPASRGEPTGLIVEVLRIEDVVESALRDLGEQGLRPEVFCDGDPSAEDRLYPPASAAPVSPAALVYEHRISVADRAWLIRVSATDAWFAAEGSLTPELLALFLILMTLIGTALLERRVRTLRDLARLAERESKAREALAVELERTAVLVDRLKVVNNLLDSVLRGLPVGVAIFHGPEDRLFRINAPAADWLGVDAEQALERPLDELLPEDAGLGTDLRAVRSRGQPIEGRKSRTSPPGREPTHRLEWILPVQVGTAPEHAAIIAVVADTTELEQARKRQRQTQKLESLGTLAGGIAHDFNNILSAIRAHLELLALAIRDEGEDAPAIRHVVGLERAAQRAGDLVRQILAFSRQEPPRSEAVDVIAAIKDALLLIRAATPSRVRIDLEAHPGSATILGDSTQIQQVIMNLCTNAVRAIGDRAGGVGIRVRAEHGTDGIPAVAPDVGAPAEFAEVARPRVIISVTDDGVGMAADQLERIFDPFFTTRPVGEGSGLGLAVVDRIVRAHGGRIHVESEPGRGSTFTIALPERLAASEKGSAGETRPRILVVEDDPMILELYKTILTAADARLCLCRDGAEGLAAFEREPEAFELLLTDVEMPGISGAELAERVLARRPELPVIVVTGYSEDFDEASATALGVRRYLLKPVGPKELLQAVVACLEEEISPE